MNDTTSAFWYKDHLTGKILVDPDDEQLKRPVPRDLKDEYSDTVINFEDGYSDRLIYFIDQMIDRARGGSPLSRVDALMTSSYFLERKWPLPDSLSTYVAEILEKAVIAYGHTDGRVERKKTAICNALGLAMPKGAPLTEQNATKRMIVHSYIWWQMAFSGETLHSAANRAVNAFSQADGLSHGACKKMYTAHEDERIDKHRSVPSLRAFLALKLHPKAALDHYGIRFKDNPFLCKIAPHLLDESLQKDGMEELVEDLINALKREGLTVPSETKTLYVP